MTGGSDDTYSREHERDASTGEPTRGELLRFICLMVLFRARIPFGIWSECRRLRARFFGSGFVSVPAIRRAYPLACRTETRKLPERELVGMIDSEVEVFPRGYSK